MFPSSCIHLLFIALSHTFSCSRSSSLQLQIVYRSTTILPRQSKHKPVLSPYWTLSFPFQDIFKCIISKDKSTSSIKRHRHTSVNNLFVWTSFVPFQVSNGSRNKSCCLNLLDSQDSIPFRATPWKHNNRIRKEFWFQISTSPRLSLCFLIYTTAPLNAQL